MERVHDYRNTEPPGTESGANAIILGILASDPAGGQGKSGICRDLAANPPRSRIDAPPLADRARRNQRFFGFFRAAGNEFPGSGLAVSPAILGSPLQGWAGFGGGGPRAALACRLALG